MTLITKIDLLLMTIILNVILDNDSSSV